MIDQATKFFQDNQEAYFIHEKKIGYTKARRELQVIKAHPVRFQTGVWRSNYASQPNHGRSSRYAI